MKKSGKFFSLFGGKCYILPKLTCFTVAQNCFVVLTVVSLFQSVYITLPLRIHSEAVKKCYFSYYYS